MIARRRGRRRAAGRAHRDVLDRVLDGRPSASPSRSTGRARSSSPSRRARTACGCAARCPNGRRPATRAVQPARARRARRRDAPLRQDPSVHLRRASTSTTRPATRSSPSTSRACAAAFFVCYDLRFADEFWPLAPTPTATSSPANWPAAAARALAALLRARAIENQAYVVGVNRVGSGDGSSRTCGDSVIIDPLGEVGRRGAATASA